MFSGFPPPESLLESLIGISDEISSMGNLPPVQIKNISAMAQRIRLLSPLFNEIHERNTPLLPSAILCFTELLSLMRRARLLIQGCHESSYLWSLIRTEFMSEEFNTIVKGIGKALDILPLQLMDISTDIREQIELLQKQAKRADLSFHCKEIERRKELLQIMETLKQRNDNNYHGFLHVGIARDVLTRIGLRSSVDFAEEISKLKEEAGRQGGTGGPMAVSSINRLVAFVSYIKSMSFSFEENERALENLKKRTKSKKLGQSSSSTAMLIDIPDEFLCPISLEIMKEPVVVATGHTYDRESITQWINSGHHKTCPKSGQKLTHMALIPNYNLKSLIHQWHQENNIPLIKFRTSSCSELQGSNRKGKLSVEAVRLTAEFLVGKLATASPEMQSRAAYEIRLLAKNSMDNRRIIAEVGAVPFLVTLLSSHEPETQENSMTALLNLSIHSHNKVLIIEAGALDKIIQVLESGKTMEGRENAAALISSLSLIDDYRAVIGAQPRAVTALVGLLRKGKTTGKRDAAIALFNLAYYNPNKKRVVIEGTVPLLIDVLMDENAEITDDALALLALLSGCSEGVEDIKKSKELIPFLIDVLRFGSPKGKENSVTLLLVLSKDGGEEVVRHLDPQSFPLLRGLAANGSPEAQRKAGALLRLLIRCCSNPAVL